LVSSSWEAKDASRLHAEIHQALVTRGDWFTVEQKSHDGALKARARGDLLSEVRYLNGEGGAQLAQFKYRAALQTLINARDLSRKLGNPAELAAVLMNLSSLYQQLWDTHSALTAAEEARSATEGLRSFRYLPELMLLIGRLQPAESDTAAETYFRQGIEGAHKRGDAASLEAQGLDLLGDLLRRRGELIAALEAHRKAYQMRLAKAPAEVGFSFYWLAETTFAQGNLTAAARWNEQALRVKPGMPSFPAFRLHRQKGLILAAGKNGVEALREFRASVDLAQTSRRAFLPAMSVLDRANAGLEEAVFDSFVEASASAAIAQKDQNLAEESFLAGEGNRAEGLRQSIDLRDVWRAKLPVDYWSTLAALRSEQARLLAAHQNHSALSDGFELKLSEMEAQAGLDFSHEKVENFRAFRSLKHILEGLRETEVLLSFHLGKEKSFLWAVTRNSLRLYPLASRDRIRKSVKEFRDAVQQASPDAGKLGSELYRELFGRLRKEEASKPSWLLSLEDVLFELPFSALLPEAADQPNRSRPVYLVERNSIQIVPGAFSLRRESPAQKGEGRLVAVGDPIYNTADPRWQQELLLPKGAFRLRPAFFRAPQSTTTLNRLAGSGREAEAVARIWGFERSTLLIGADARRDSFVSALAKNPEVVHVATHAMAARLPQPKAFLALGLGADAQPEFLSETDIGTLRIPGALVVLTGCSTATGDILEGAGLLGLTEAWAAAGARGVVATQWPVPDQTGAFLPGFYRGLKTLSTADSLRQTQIAMIRAGSSPSLWASYELFGGAR
jgi:CHAT domain-containing protein